MNPFNLYEAYTAVYDEDLRDELEVIDEDLSFIDDLSDNELTQIMEEILRDGEVGLNECYYAFDEEVLTEARVTTGRGGEAGSSRRVTYSKGDVERRERVGRKHAAKRLQVATGRAAERIRSGAESAKTKAGGAISALAGGAAEAGRKGKAAAQRVGGKLAAAKERISGFVKRVGKAAGAGYKAAKAEFSGQAAREAKARDTGRAMRRAARRRARGSGPSPFDEPAGRSTVGGSSDGGQKETEQSGREVKATATKLGLEKLQKKPGSQGKLTFSRHMRKRVVPIGSGGKELEGAAYSQSVRSARKDKSVKESYETLTISILEDLIYEGYAGDYNEALYILESMSDYEVGELAESYLVEEDFEAWVEGLWEEGYDLSDYTWEGLYEAYIDLYEGYVPFEGKPMRKLVSKKTDLMTMVDPQYLGPGTKRDRERLGKMVAAHQRMYPVPGKPAKDPKRNNKLPESYDAYDDVLNYLLDEGYAETTEDATTIMANMSEEWRDEILEVTGGGKVAYFDHSKSGDSPASRGMRYSPFIKSEIKNTQVDSRIGTNKERPTDKERLRRLRMGPEKRREEIERNKKSGLKKPPRRPM